MSGQQIGRWRVVRPRDQWTGGYRRYWEVVSPWTIAGGYIKCSVRQFDTWREAFDYASREAAACES
jgi:hypothetical protein